MKTISQFQNSAAGKNQPGKTAIYIKIVLFAFVVIGVILQPGFNPCSAQGNNLQFSRVLLVTTSATVPSNTIWKVENILPSASLVNNPTQNSSTKTDCIITVNSTAVIVSTGIAGIYDGTSSGSVTCSSGSCNYSLSQYVTNMWAWGNGYATGGGQILNGPIWLPASTTLAPSTNVYAVSVVEFNIVP